MSDPPRVSLAAFLRGDAAAEVAFVQALEARSFCVLAGDDDEANASLRLLLQGTDDFFRRPDRTTFRGTTARSKHGNMPLWGAGYVNRLGRGQWHVVVGADDDADLP